MQIRLATPDDYPALSNLRNLVYPDDPLTAAELKRADDNRDPMCRFRRWVALKQGQPVGYALYTQHADMYHPQHFWLDIAVHPDYRQRGVGAALYDILSSDLQAFDPLVLRVQGRENQAERLQFWQQRGFREYGRRWQSSLDVAAFDLTPFTGYEQRLATQGINLQAYSALGDDPDRDRKLYELQWELDQAVPGADQLTKMRFEQFKRQVTDNPAFVQQGTFIAIHDTEFVGMSSLFLNEADNSLVIDLTGTRKPYRRKGIALGLKLHGIVYAQAHGHPRIVVHNDEANVGMLALNERLGFKRGPAIVQLAREAHAA